MSMLADNSAVMEKTKELCAAIVAEEEFSALMGDVETFLANDEARLQYQSVHEAGDELNMKQRSGVELSETEVKSFEDARDQLLQNEVASKFLNARQNLESVQQAVSQYIGMTLELGRVPEPADFQNSGCCGGSGSEGGGCGCA